jgi:3-hydroxyacyl-CoA dehydrogenase
MGSGIAVILPILVSKLLDIVPRELTDAEAKKGLTLESKIVRNRLVNEHLSNALKSKPSYLQSKFANRITTGNNR